MTIKEYDRRVGAAWKRLQAAKRKTKKAKRAEVEACASYCGLWNARRRLQSKLADRRWKRGA